MAMQRRRGEGGSDTGLSSEGGDGQGATGGKDGLGWSSARVGSSSSASSTDQSVLYVQAKDQPWEVKAVANRLKEQLSSTHAHLALDQTQAGGSYDRDEDDREWGIAPLFRMAGPLWHGIAWFNGMITLSWPFEALYVVAITITSMLTLSMVLHAALFLWYNPDLLPPTLYRASTGPRLGIVPGVAELADVVFFLLCTGLPIFLMRKGNYQYGFGQRDPILRALQDDAKLGDELRTHLRGLVLAWAVMAAGTGLLMGLPHAYLCGALSDPDDGSLLVGRTAVLLAIRALTSMIFLPNAGVASDGAALGAIAMKHQARSFQALLVDGRISFEDAMLAFDAIGRNIDAFNDQLLPLASMYIVAMLATATLHLWVFLFVNSSFMFALTAAVICTFPIGFAAPMAEINQLNARLVETVANMRASDGGAGGATGGGWTEMEILRMVARLQTATNTKLRVFGVEITSTIAAKVMSITLTIWFVIYNSSELSLRALVGLDVTVTAE